MGVLKTQSTLTIAVWVSVLIHTAGFLGFELAFSNIKESFPKSEPRTVTIVSISSVTSPMSLPEKNQEKEAETESSKNIQGKVLEQSFSKISEQKENELQDEIMEKPITSEIVSNNISIDKQEYIIPDSGNSQNSVESAVESGDGGETFLITEPIPLVKIEPNYPFRARKKGLEGVVVLDVVISSLGEPSSCKIAASSGYKDLDNAALDTVLSASYYPGTENGKNIESTLRISIRFQLNKS